MARVTARHAYTRAKSKRQQGKADASRAFVEARRRYARQLSTIGIQVEGGSQLAEVRAPRGRSKSSGSANQQWPAKKITDYFSVTKSLDFMSKVKQPLKTSSSFDPNGIECVTIYDSDNELCGSFGSNTPASTFLYAPDINSNVAEDNVLNNGPTNGNNNQITENSKQGLDDVKPIIAKLNINNLDVSFADMQLKVRVDDDIEIVDMLPPIPLRKHEIFDLDDGEEDNE